ncbi:unnamed protein product [Calicophoron daubneyi]|uniref:Uncharacterized protein n=1 Tax=Calicophoron daubneyi TaxID=300641 RepID=A0AAV2T3B9_CALDB
MNRWSLNLSIRCACILYSVLLSSSGQPNGKCECTLNKLNDTDPTNFVICSRETTQDSTMPTIPCEQIDDLIRIGPMPNTLSIKIANGSEEIIDSGTVRLAPWAFANLFQENSVHQLQLNLKLTGYESDALAMGGLENVWELLARTSHIRWSGCSFANMPSMRRVLLSCHSIHTDFLTFGASVEVIHFVECEGRQIQFYCTRCLQQPGVNVIRIRPGPPLRQYMVKFSHLSPPGLTGDNTTEEKHLPVGKCIPDICSDDMLCRNDIPLQLARSNVGRPVISQTTENITTAFASLAETATTTSPQNLTSTSRDLRMNQFQSTRNDSDRKRSGKPKMPSSLVPLTRSQRMWISASILTVIVVFLITSCIFIALAQKRKRKRQMKMRGRRRPRISGRPPKTIHNGSPCLDEDTRLELPDLA